MKKIILLGIAISSLLSAPAGPADWLTDGPNPQRTNWQKDETILNKGNVQNLKILWKVKLDNAPREMHSLLPVLIADKVPTAAGPREIVIATGVSDNIYALDATSGATLWKKHFEYP